MKRARAVLKSKSSNTYMRTVNKNKKSWSSGEVVDKSKKRGVYVEKKTHLSSNNQPNEGETNATNTVQAQPSIKRPKRGNKPFLNSVLTILQQDTEETQFPESDVLRPNKKTRIRKRLPVDTTEVGIQDLDAAYGRENSPDKSRAQKLQPQVASYKAHKLKSQFLRTNLKNKSVEEMQDEPETQVAMINKKNRFRSRALNENFDDRVVVLQRKQFLCTSSSYVSSINTGSKITIDRPKLKETLDEEQLLVEMNASQKNNGKISDEESNKESLYKFFVNLLQDSMSSDDKKAEANADNLTQSVCPNVPVGNVNKIKERISSGVKKICDKLEKEDKIRVVAIDETLANNINKHGKEWHNDFGQQNTIVYPVIDVQDDRKFVTYPEDVEYDMDKIAVYEAVSNREGQFWSPYNELTRKKLRFMKPKSRVYNYTIKEPAVKWTKNNTSSKSNPPKKKTKYSNWNSERDNPLLNMLKRELENDYHMDFDYEEPITMHEALQSLVRDKKRTRRAIRRAEFSTSSVNGDDRSECLLNNEREFFTPKAPRKIKRVKSLKPTKSEPSPLQINIPRTPNNDDQYYIDGILDEDKQERFDLIYDDAFADSVHSIKVQGYEYEGEDKISVKLAKLVSETSKTSVASKEMQRIENHRYFDEIFVYDVGEILTPISHSISRILMNVDVLD